MSEKVKSIFLDNTTVFGDNIVDHDLTTSWKTVFGDDNPNINNDSLVAYWRFFDDSSVATEITDSSGNGHDIALLSGLSLSHDTPYENKNTTVSFNGTSDYGTVSDSDDLSFGDGATDSPFSISCWIKPGDLALNFTAGIISKENEYNFYLKNRSTDPMIKDYSVTLQLVDDPAAHHAYEYVLDTESVSEGSWFNIVVSYNGAGLSATSTTDPIPGINFYVNGVYKNHSDQLGNETGAYIAMPNTTNDMIIGRYNSSSSTYIEGNLSELAIWNRELTATEAKTLHDVKYGVLLKSSMVTYSSYTPRLMLRDSDNRRGQYPTVRRTGDKDRSGSFNIQFNDENTVEYKKIPTVYPGEKDQSFSITDGSTSYTYSSQASLVAHWRPQDAVIPTAAGIPITTPWGATRFIGGSVPVGGQAYIANKVPSGQIAYVENFAAISDKDDPRHTGFTERDGKIYEARGTRNSYKYLFQDDSDDGLNIGTAATWDAIIGDNTTDGSTQKMTFSAWIYKTGDGGTSIGTILDFGSQDISLWSTSTEELVFNTKWDGNKKIAWASAPGVFSLNTWTHISITYDATNALNNPALYIDGILTSMPLSSGVQTGAYYGIAVQDGFIGNASNLDRGWEGNIADVAIWNSLLSADEVKALYLNDTRWNPDIPAAQEVQYPIGLLKDDSRLPELTPDITSKGLVTRSHGGESFSIITDGEDISAYNDELDKTQDTDFYNVGTDREVYPGFSSPLRSKTSFTFDITATDEQYVFRQTADANPTGEFPGEDYTGFCYYAFGKNKWEQIGLINPEDGSDRVYAYGADVGVLATLHAPNLSDCGPQNFPMQFSGNAGFTIYGNENSPSIFAADKTVLGYEKIGAPTSTSFAPFGTQYHATSSQTLKVDDFITDPFLLEKITIKLPIEARHLVLSDADKTRDLTNYVAFLYLQRNSKSERVTTSERSIIAASSFCFYNNKVLTDNNTSGGEYIPFSPIHDYDFSHEFDIDAMVDFDDEITLEFTPEIFNPVHVNANIPNIDDLLGTAVLTPGNLPITLPATAHDDRLILEDTLGATHIFIFDGSVGDGTDIALDTGSYDNTMYDAASVISATDSFNASYDSGLTRLTIKQARGGSTGATDIRYWDDSAGTSSVIETFSTTTYNTVTNEWKSFWPGGSSALPFTVDGITTYSGKSSDIDLEFTVNVVVSTFGNPYEEYAGDLEKIIQNTRLSKQITRHVKNYGTNRTRKEDDYDPATVATHDYFSVKDISQKTAFVLLPGDELILGIEKTTCGDRLGPGTAPNSYQFGLDSQQSFSGSYIKIKTEPASMTMYGSLIKENKEHHNTINQDLTSNSVHEAFYGVPVLDEFEIEPISMYAGTTRDEYVTGDMFTGKNETLVIPATIEEDDSSTVRRPITSVTAGDVSDTWSLTRFNTYADESERFYDTLLPDIYEYLKTGDSDLEKLGPQSSYSYYSFVDDTDIVLINETDLYSNKAIKQSIGFPFNNNLIRQDSNDLILLAKADEAAFVESYRSVKILTFTEGFSVKSVSNALPPFTNLSDNTHGQTGGCMGFKHGVRNITPITTTASFRSNSYGQFRDMLEQRHFGRFYKSRSFSPVFAGTPGFSGIQTLNNTLTRREQATTRITIGPLIIKFVEQNSSTSTEPNLTDSSNLNAHATSSLPFFDDIDTYNSGSGRNRPHIPSNYLVKNTTVIASSAVLDFGFDPSDLS